MLGWQSDLRPALAKHAVFVLPSTYGEGVPRSGQEALASGRPVITTDWQGCRDLIEDGVQGHLVQPHDPRAIADRLIELFSNTQELAKLQAASRLRAERCFDINKTSAQLVSVVLGDCAGVGT
jgi:glycosyltransferase involved in cell wall biosynthesis